MTNDLRSMEPANRATGRAPTDTRCRLAVILCRCLLTGSLAAFLAGQVAAETQKQTQPTPSTASAPAKSSSGSKETGTRHPLPGMPDSARQYYELAWGIDQLSVKLAESGQLVRFSYRVTDIGKAKVLHEKASTPYLLDEKVHAVLQVPVMEKVGPLRQAVAPEHGKAYWMVFSNKGNIVKAGHRVSVVIGQFRADGLLVQP